MKTLSIPHSVFYRIITNFVNCTRKIDISRRRPKRQKRYYLRFERRALSDKRDSSKWLSTVPFMDNDNFALEPDNKFSQYNLQDKNVQINMRKIKSLCIIALLVIGLFPTLKAQQSVNTLYFIKNNPLRHELNPSFQPLSNFYLSLGGNSQFGFYNNSLALKDMVHKNNQGEYIFFFHPDGDKNKFYNALENNTLINLNTQSNLFGFGFRTGPSYWTFDASLKSEGNITIPKGLMSLLLYGTQEQDKMNNFNLGSLGMGMSIYGEFALDYSRKINDRWTVGGRAKFLYGIAKFSMINNDLQFSAGNILADGIIYIALPGNLYISENLDSINYEMPKNIGESLKPKGLGSAIDLGAEFKIMDQLTLSAAIIDIGFIRWKNNAQNISYKTIISNLGDSDSEHLFDSIQWSKEGTDIKKTMGAFNSWLAPKLHLGMEYAFASNKLSLGLLSKTTVYYKRFYEELTASFNACPINWFNFSLSYSILNGRVSTLGAGIGLRTGSFYWLLAADYVPLQYQYVDYKNLSIPVPYNSKAFNCAIGCNIVIGNKKKSNKGGIADKFDLCPDMLVEAYGYVDENSCPLYSGEDGAFNYLDK
ncbi:MAG: DUF5723 family protein [Bacteroidales bacterium]|jgi:hypothetical protein|nr:DUF5723 family protein [Bacteroidales bacterium]